MNYRYLKFLCISFTLIFFRVTTLHAQCPAVADFDFDRVCNMGQVHFQDQSFLTDTGQIVQWNWDFGDGNTSIAQNPMHNYVPGASYNVQLTVTDSSGCTSTIIIPVFVDPLPVAGYTFTPNNACSGSLVSFTNTSTGSGLTYSWNFGDGSPVSTLPNPTHTYTSYGCGTQNYTATLTVTDSNGCTSTVSHTVSVLQQPDVLYLEVNGFRFCHTDTLSISDTAMVFNFSPSSACISSYTIDWGDGSPLEVIPLPFDATNGIDHIYTSLGYFTVTITATGTNGCVSSYSEVMTIESNPVAVLVGPAMGTNTGCAPMHVCVTNISQNISGTTLLEIDWGDGTNQVIPPSAVGDSICHDYHISGCNNGTMTNYAITLTASNACDFSSVSWAPIRVFEPPQAEFTIADDSICVDDAAIFTNITIPNSCASNSSTLYTWDFGDGTTFGPSLIPWGANPQQTVTHVYADTGSYTVTLIATNNSTNGCGSSQFSMTLYVSDAYADFTFDTVCYGSSTQFIDQSWGVNSYIVDWEWHFGDGETSNQTNPGHIYTAWGDFNAWLVITTNLGCTDTMWHVVHVDTLPFVDFLFDTVCFGDTTHFTDISQGHGASIISWQWNFGDGNSTNTQHPDHLYGASGNYTVTLIVIDSNGCSDTIQHLVPVSPPPLASFTADTACFGYITQFQSTSTTSFGSITTWSWDFGDGLGTGTGPNPQYLYGDTGTFMVTLIVITNIGCLDTVILPVYVSPNPIADFLADTVCSGNPTSFTDLSDGNGTVITTWSWDFGDGNSSTLQNPTHTYINPGSYQVQLIVFNQFNCSDTIIHTVITDSIPFADFSYTPTCPGDTTFFTDLSIAYGSAITNWIWDFGDGQTSTLQHPSNLYAGPGVYSVTLIIFNSSGCSDTISLPVVVFDPPVADFSWAGTCEGTTTQFTDSSSSSGSTIQFWNWDFGDGNTSTIQHPSHQYADSGFYSVTLIISDLNGCNDTIVQTIYISPLPQADFTNTAACAGDSVQFTDISDGMGQPISIWNWNLGDGNTSTIQHPSHQYVTSGTYIVQLIIQNTWGCSDTVSHTVIADSLPFAQFSAPAVCLNDTSFFTDLSTSNGGAIVSWYWDFGDGTTDTVQNPSHVFATAGIWNVTLHVFNSAGCSDTVTISVIVHQLPIADFTYSSACLLQNINFTDLSTGGTPINSWSWDFGDGSGTSTFQNPVYQYNTITTYNVILYIIDMNGCRDSVDLPVSVEPVPNAEFVFDSVCLGLNTSLTDISNDNGSAITSWTWDFGDGNGSNTQNNFYTYGNAGTFFVQLIVTNSGNCSDTVVHPVFVKPSPTASYTTANVCDGLPVSFTDLSISNSIGITSWIWDFGDSSGSTAQNPSHQYGSFGIYNVNLIVENDWGCTDSMNQPVEVYELPVADFTAGMACIGYSTSFIDSSFATGTMVTDWSWDFGDGLGSSNLQNPIYTYSLGTPPYTVTLIIEDGHGCFDTIVHNIDLHPQPTADFTATSECSQTATAFTDFSSSTTGTILQWNWDFGDGLGSSNLQNPDYTYNSVLTTTTFNVTLIATDNNGCPDTISHLVTLYPNPVADFISSTVCSGQPSIFTDFSTSNGGTIQSWDWEFGDGSGTSVLQNPSYLYSGVTSISTFTTTLIVHDSNNCTDTTTSTVIVNPLPIAGFTANTACSGTATMFTDTSFSNGGNITSWDWNFGDGSGTSSIQHPGYTYGLVLVPTTYNVTITVEDVNGCIGDSVIPVIVNPLPIAEFTTNASCSGYPSAFNDLSSSTGGSISQWDWDFGDGSGSSILQNPVYTYPPAAVVTTYNVYLTVTDANGCIDTVVHQASIIPSPSGDFITDSVCSGEISFFTDLSTTLGGTISSWSWDFGDGIGNSVLQDPNYQYGNVLTTTTYQVQFIVENSYGCRDTVIQSSVVYPLPITDFNADTACFGDLTIFLDQSTSMGGNISQWLWDFGDSSGTSNQQNPQYTYGGFGYYPVSLQTTDINQCSSQITQTIFVDSLPIPNFDWISTCVPGIITFTNTSNGNGSNIVSYYWDFDDGFMAGLQNPAHYYAGFGTYQVSLTVLNDRGCSNQIIIPVNVNPGLEADFTAADVCFGEDVHFLHYLINPNIPIETWLWSFGDGTYSTLPDPIHLYSQPGTYNVLLTVTDSLGCDYTISHQVTIFVLPDANFSANIVQLGDPTIFTDLSFTANGVISSWQWNFGDGSTSVQQSPLHTYGAAGTYQVTLIVFNSFGCSDTIILPVIVNALVIADFISDTVCAGSPMHFSDLSHTGIGTIDLWYWSFGDGYSSIDQNPIHVYALDGVYTVTLIVTASFGITDTVSYQVYVLESPDANFNFTEVCFGNPTEFFDQSTGTNSPVVGWEWNLGDGNSSVQPTIQHYYNQSGQWQVQLISTNSIGCSDTISKPVNVWEIPTVMFDAEPREGCLPLPVFFSDLTTVSDGVITSWLWSFGDGFTSVSAGGASHLYPYPGSFDISLSVISNHGCENSLSIPNMIQVFPSPIASFIYNPTSPTIADPGIMFYDLSLGASQWWWNFGDGDESTYESPLHSYSQPGTYDIIHVVYNEYGCADTTAARIHINSDEIIWFPNAISINGDGLNDHFVVYGLGWQTEGFEMRIFNRWGQEIYYTTDFNAGWDGTEKHTGRKVPPGVYVWKVTAVDASFDIQHFVGTVTVIY